MFEKMKTQVMFVRYYEKKEYYFIERVLSLNIKNLITKLLLEDN